MEQNCKKKSLIEQLLKVTRVEPRVEAQEDTVKEVQNFVVDEAYSSYEDSDGDVNSPGESKEDDMRGKKYMAYVPVVSEYTNWTKWVWVVGTRFPTRKAFKDAVRSMLLQEAGILKLRQVIRSFLVW